MYTYKRQQDCINGNTHKENERSLPLARDGPDYNYIPSKSKIHISL